ncbi:MULTISPECIES: hypothetical protein [unclassified Neochlamydia]|uniref:hypothetical protein n=1 Tax=unclassified Neochlamydia TaxID=2643326 RepID=UPI00140763AE|nr:MULTISPECIES: hypothetical protein [unclassified Neochlamydia]MBS4171471.1 Uncharacterized protein [Neochlamydia sp. AcF95]NGY95000.1 hypothetical protein [Neochlamydia sp. AcF84]
MITDIESLNLLDLDQFSADLEELKQEIITEEAGEDEDDVILEVIKVIQEEIVKRKSNPEKKDLASNVKFLAYINLFNSLFGEADFEELDEDELEDIEEDEEEK